MTGWIVAGVLATILVGVVVYVARVLIEMFKVSPGAVISALRGGRSRDEPTE